MPRVALWRSHGTALLPAHSESGDRKRSGDHPRERGLVVAESRRDEESPSLKDAAKRGQRARQVGHGMKNVGRDDGVELARVVAKSVQVRWFARDVAQTASRTRRSRISTIAFA